ncbi:MAG: hypothetical protein ACXIUW_12700 [Roseinatronobacter sp.]
MQTSHDPKGLIRESYRIEGISDGECRSILIDWALSLPADTDQHAALEALIEHYGAGAEDHPMTVLLRSGLRTANTPARRGRRRREE